MTQEVYEQLKAERERLKKELKEVKAKIEVYEKEASFAVMPEKDFDGIHKFCPNCARDMMVKSMVVKRQICPSYDGEEEYEDGTISETVTVYGCKACDITFHDSMWTGGVWSIPTALLPTEKQKKAIEVIFSVLGQVDDEPVTKKEASVFLGKYMEKSKKESAMQKQSYGGYGGFDSAESDDADAFNSVFNSYGEND